MEPSAHPVASLKSLGCSLDFWEMMLPPLDHCWAGSWCGVSVEDSGFVPRDGDTARTGLLQSLGNHPQPPTFLGFVTEGWKQGRNKGQGLGNVSSFRGASRPCPGRDGAIPKFLSWQGQAIPEFLSWHRWSNPQIPACFFPWISHEQPAQAVQKHLVENCTSVDLFPAPSTGNLPALQSRPSSSFSRSLFISRDF